MTKKKRTSAGKKPPSRRTATKKPPETEEKDLRLPAGFREDGETMASLAEVCSPDEATMECCDLTDDHWARLTVERLREHPSYEIAVFGVGVVDQEQAIDEVSKQTDLGKVLMEVEERMIKRLVKRSTNR